MAPSGMRSISIYRDFRRGAFLGSALNNKKLRGKFWIKDFADLIIDRTWEELEKAKGHGKEKGTHRR
jgi:hypothetical protein